MKRRALNLEPLGCRHVPGDLNAIGECKSCRQQINEHARLRAEVKRLRTAARHLIDSLDIENPGPAQRELMAALKPLKKGTR